MFGVDGSGTARNSASVGMRFIYWARLMSCSVMIGWDRFARSMSASLTVPTGWAHACRIDRRRIRAVKLVTWPRMRLISETDTAVPFPEQHEGEVLAAHGKFLARAPQHRGAAEGLAAFA